TGSGGSSSGGSDQGGSSNGGSGDDDSSGSSSRGKNRTASAKDPRHVIRTIRNFHPLGNGRAKIVELRDEAKTLKLNRQPHAFCFLLRSMFELSAKAY